MKGKLITFEGGEGAGKTTLIEALFSHLQKEGLSVVKTHAPGGTLLGKAIRELLLHKKDIPVSSRAELFLFLADRAEHVESIILPALEKEEIVLCDRFNDSTIAYQGEGRGFGMDIVKELCTFASGSLQPDLTFYLDLDPAIGMQRRGSVSKKDKIESEKIAFHQKIREAFLLLAKEEPERICIIDASLPIPEVFEQTMQKLCPLLT